MSFAVQCFRPARAPKWETLGVYKRMSVAETAARSYRMDRVEVHELVRVVPVVNQP